MGIYKNSKFIKRDYECTNIVYCETKNDEMPDCKYIDWEKTDLDMVPLEFTQLYIENGIKYFGHM